MSNRLSRRSERHAFARFRKLHSLSFKVGETVAMPLPVKATHVKTNIDTVWAYGVDDEARYRQLSGLVGFDEMGWTMLLGQNETMVLVPAGQFSTSSSGISSTS